MGQIKLYIPDELHTELKVYAAKNKVSMSKIVAELIQRFLEEQKKK